MMTNSTSQQQQKLDTYLRFQLAADTQALMPMNQMQEVVLIPLERITPMPNMPPHVLGLLNQRSRVFWVLDLSAMLGFDPIDVELREYNLVIIRANHISMGLVVQRVYGVTRLATETIQSPIGIVPPAMTPYLKGCVLQPRAGILLVLEPSALINSPIF